MTAEAAQGLVVGGVEEPIEVVFAIVIEGNTVTHEEVTFWLEIVDVARGLDRRIIVNAELGVSRGGHSDDAEEK